MAGVVLETLSNRKLLILTVILFIVQIIFFLVGGIVAPSPSNVQNIIGTICLDEGNHVHKQAWYQSRGKTACRSVPSFDDPYIKKNNINTNQIIFTFQFPLPRNNQELDMSRWFQNLISVVDVRHVYKKDMEDSGAALDTEVTFDARLGYRDKADEDDGNWTEIARSSVSRNISCEFVKKEDGYPINCDLLPFFELGSCHHDHYLLNIRIPVHGKSGMNLNLYPIDEITLSVIHQNGGFTKVWLSMKTILFPILMAALVWFWHRIAQLNRNPILLEKTLFALGLTLSFLNLPVEWLTLQFDMPFMLLVSDIRQGVFYAGLLCFWIIFAGEHMMDQVERNRLVLYWKHLAAVVFGCVCLCLFEICERGVQLTNPFYSIWVTDTGRNLALGFIILAGICACLYFLLLCYMSYKVLRNISAKKTALPNMTKARRKYYMGLIFRFKFLMVVTLFCAATTVIFFILSQVSEGHWKWGEQVINYTSAFFTGVYGMWNIYVFCLLALYAPSHKYKPVAGRDDDVTQQTQELTQEGASEEVIEFSSMPTEASSLAAFAKKTAED